MPRPGSVTALGIVLILTAAVLLLSLMRYVPGYFEVAQLEDVGTRRSLLEYLLERPQDTLLPPLIGLASAIAAVGVFGGRRWARPLAIAVGLTILAGGVLLLLIAVSGLGAPGSFAVLIFPPAILALLIGGFVVYAALRNAAYLHR